MKKINDEFLSIQYKVMYDLAINNLQHFIFRNFINLFEPSLSDVLSEVSE